MGIYIQYIYKKNCGVSFWTCWWEISGDRVALFLYYYYYYYNSNYVPTQSFVYVWCCQKLGIQIYTFYFQILIVTIRPQLKVICMHELKVSHNWRYVILSQHLMTSHILSGEMVIFTLLFLHNPLHRGVMNLSGRWGHWSLWHTFMVMGPLFWRRWALSPILSLRFVFLLLVYVYTKPLLLGSWDPHLLTVREDMCSAGRVASCDICLVRGCYGVSPVVMKSSRSFSCVGEPGHAFEAVGFRL